MKTINTPIKSDTMWDHYITIKIMLSYFLINNHTMWSYKNVKTWCIQAPEEVANNARLSQFTEQKISVVVCVYSAGTQQSSLVIPRLRYMLWYSNQ